MAEPYVLAADVSSCENLGRAGWTWYTGSASWCFKTMLEGFLGVSVKDGNIVIDPAPPKALSTYDVIYDDKSRNISFILRRRTNIRSSKTAWIWARSTHSRLSPTKTESFS